MEKVGFELIEEENGDRAKKEISEGVNMLQRKSTDR